MGSLTGGSAAEERPAEPIRVLLVTGENNHDWEYTSKVHKETLEATGRFRVDITEKPGVDLADAGKLHQYGVFVLDYNGARWGDAAEKAFAKAVADGTGVVFIHAANNAFTGWDEFEKMAGLLWREGTGHGEFHAFDVKITDKSHPITAGLSDLEAHPDELYHKLVNTQHVPVTVLATAYSSPEKRGTGHDEPMAIVLNYGKGRVFQTPLGHVWRNDEKSRVSINDPQFKVLLARGTEWAATGSVTLPAEWTFGVSQVPQPPKQEATAKADQGSPNALTDAEKAAGWVLLFDGKSSNSFRGYKQEKFPSEGWVVEDGALHRRAGKEAGDIVMAEQYSNFELAFQWKVAKGSNSGVMYRVTEDHQNPWETGPEYQILDDQVHQDGKNPKTSAASCYGLYAPQGKQLKPVGEWNDGKIVVRGNHVEHWLNGAKVVEYELGSPEWKALVAACKFKDMPDYGTRSTGSIDFQDHGDEVWYRGIKVRRVDAR
jgi:type 1 glutamine amidotransferase